MSTAILGCMILFGLVFNAIAAFRTIRELRRLRKSLYAPDVRHEHATLSAGQIETIKARDEWRPQKPHGPAVRRHTKRRRPR